MTSPYELPKLHAHAEASRRAGRKASTLIRLGHWFGLITAAGGLLVLAAYALDIEAIWRPLSSGPATHPTTAILFVLGGVAVASIRPMRVPPIAVAALLAVALVAAGRIFEFATGFNILHVASLFQPPTGAPIAVGWNSAVMFVLVPFAYLLRYGGKQRASQIVAAFSMGTPLVALTGYLYGVAEFYGSMSLTTAIIGLFFSASPLLLGARTGIMRAIFSPWDGGRFGRLEIAVIATVIFVGGFAVHLANPDSGRAMPLYVVLALLATSITIAFCTIVIERNDWLRRKAERAISRLVLRDALSGLYNRRFLREQEKSIVAFARRKRYELSVLMIDIDNFKSINDTYGHPVGDKVIRRIADTIRSRLRGTDIVIRYGGEEMLAILLDTELARATRVAEELRTSIAGLDFSDVGFRSLTVSIGVAQALNTLTEAIGRADVALYLAKKSGRNRVVTDETHLRPTLVAPGTDAKEPSPRRLRA